MDTIDTEQKEKLDFTKMRDLMQALFDECQANAKEHYEFSKAWKKRRSALLTENGWTESEFYSTLILANKNNKKDEEKKVVETKNE